MDKVVFKDLIARAGLPQVDYARSARAADGAARGSSALGLPVWVKPARLGSSVGIVRVGDADELEGALDARSATTRA